MCTTVETNIALEFRNQRRKVTLRSGSASVAGSSAAAAGSAGLGRAADEHVGAERLSGGGAAGLAGSREDWEGVAAAVASASNSSNSSTSSNSSISLMSTISPAWPASLGPDAGGAWRDAAAEAGKGPMIAESFTTDLRRNAAPRPRRQGTINPRGLYQPAKLHTAHFSKIRWLPGELFPPLSKRLAPAANLSATPGNDCSGELAFVRAGTAFTPMDR